MKKYSVLFVHNFYQKPGGEDTVFNNEVKLLKMHGHNVYTYTKDNKEIDKMNLFIKLFLPFIYIFNIKTYFDIKKLIKEYNIDIVHCHNTWGLISQSVYYACVKMKTPVIQTMHNFRLLCPNALFYTNKHICEDCVSKGLKCAIKNKCYKNSRLQTIISVINIKFHRATGILKNVNFIALTEFNKEKLFLLNKIGKNKIIDEKKVFVKPNFVFDDGNHEIVPAKDRKYYLYVGRLDEIKGIDIVLEAFRQMPDKELHVCGSGGEEYIKEYSKYSNIKFLGQLSKEELKKEYGNKEKNMPIATITSSKCYETFGMQIIESNSFGVPVVSPNIGNLSKLVIDGVTGVHFDNSITDSLIKVINNYENVDIDKLSFNARNEYINKYSDIVNYNNIINLYFVVNNKIEKNKSN